MDATKKIFFSFNIAVASVQEAHIRQGPRMQLLHLPFIARSSNPVQCTPKQGRTTAPRPSGGPYQVLSEDEKGLGEVQIQEDLVQLSRSEEGPRRSQKQRPVMTATNINRKNDIILHS